MSFLSKLLKNDQNVTKGGSKVYKHKERTKPFTTPDSSNSSIEEMEKHYDKYIGKSELVFHEMVSDLVHIDVHWVKPTKKYNFNTFITSGMSDMPMKIAKGVSDTWKYAELVTCLPGDWPISEEDFKDENNYWPIRLLKSLARMPHEYDTWLSYGHTVRNPTEKPYAENTKLMCALITFPYMFDKEFFTLKVSKDKTIHFFYVFPVYKEEMDYKLENGTEKFEELVFRSKTPFVIDPERKNLCDK